MEDFLSLAGVALFIAAVGTWKSLGYARRWWPNLPFPSLVGWTALAWIVFASVVMAGSALYFHFATVDVVQRVPNTKGTLEAVETRSLGESKVLVGVAGEDPHDARQVIMVDQVAPSLDLSWYGNDLRISADQAAAYIFNPQITVVTPRGPVTVNVYTHVAHWLNTPGSRTGPLVPSQ